MLARINTTEYGYMEIGIVSRYDELIIYTITICGSTKLKSEECMPN